jgi:hypothetical protein
MGNVCFTPLEGGEILVVNVPSPAGATDWLYTVPAGYEMTPLSITWTFQTSALAGNRRIGYRVLGTVADGIVPRALMNFTTLIPANQTNYVVLSMENSRADQVVLNQYSDALPNVRYPAGFRWGSNSSSLLVADQHFNIYQIVIRWRV